MELEGENKFFREDKNMSEISSNSALNSYAADYSYRTEHNKKTDRLQSYCYSNANNHYAYHLCYI